MNNITYKYNNCDLEDLSKDQNFSEDIFTQILDECFEINPAVSHIDVTFVANPAQATEKFCCTINIHIPDHTHYIKESGEDSFSKIVVQACHKTVKLIRRDSNITNSLS